MTDWRSRHSVIPAVYIVFQDHGNILLLKRANTGYRDGDYSLPSGHFEPNEPGIMAAVREAKEEVGVDIDPHDLSLIHVQHRVAESGDHERINLFFVAQRWRGEIRNAELDKCDELRWADPAALPTNIVPELTHFFPAMAKHERFGYFNFT